MPVIRQFFHSHFLIIDRYLLRELSLNLFAVTSVLWLIFVATRFARYLAQAAVGNLPGDVIFTLLGFSSLGALSVLLPIATFLAVMLALGRLSSDSELTVIAACGIAGNRILRNVSIFTGFIALLIALLSLWIVPNVLSDRYDLEQQAKLSADTSGLVAGSFKESRDGDWTFYAQGLSEDGQGMENVFIQIQRKDRPLIFRSAYGHFEINSETGDKFLVLEDGFRYEGEAGDQNFTIAEYDSHSILVEKGGDKQVRERHKALPTLKLLERGTSKDIAELQWRVSMAVMTVILSLIAISLASAGPREGRYAGFFPAVLVYITYSNLLGITKLWVTKGLVTPWFGALWVHVFMLLILIVHINREKLRVRWYKYQQMRKAI